MQLKSIHSEQKKNPEVRKEMISTSFIIQNQSQVLQRRKGIVYQLGFLTRGVKRSVYLLVNQLRNPFLFGSPCPHLAMHPQSASCFPTLSQSSF